jgi:hypothetical protein
VAVGAGGEGGALTAAALRGYEEEEESMDVVGGAGSQLQLLIRPQQLRGGRRARGRSHGSERSLEEQEPGHWAAGDEHEEGNTTLTLLHHPAGRGRGGVGGEEEEEAIPSIFSLRHPLGASFVGGCGCPVGMVGGCPIP